MLFVRGGCSCDVDYMVFIGCAVHSGDCSFFFDAGYMISGIGTCDPWCEFGSEHKEWPFCGKSRALVACMPVYRAISAIVFRGACFVPVCQKEEYVIMRNRRICPCYR